MPLPEYLLLVLMRLNRLVVVAAVAEGLVGALAVADLLVVVVGLTQIFHM